MLNKKTRGALSYVLGIVTGVLFLIIDKDPFVRFHAMQSIVVFGGLFVLQTVLKMIEIEILSPVEQLLSLTGFVLWFVLIFKALKGEKWEVPIAGKYVQQLLGKI